jgi:serine/threonine protein kinase
MPAVRGATLEKLLEAHNIVPDSLVLWIYRHIMSRLHILREENLMHIDISLGNIMIQICRKNGNWVPTLTLIDFGAIRKHTDKQEKYACVLLLTLLYRLIESMKVTQTTTVWEVDRLSRVQYFFWYVRANDGERENTTPRVNRVKEVSIAGFTDAFGELERDAGGLSFPAEWHKELERAWRILSDSQLKLKLSEEN